MTLLERFARRQAGCKALMRHYGIGPRVATAMLAELGDARRFCSSRQAVRCAGLDITVYESDVRGRAGHVSRQGSPVLRWAAFEAAQCAARPGSPDHEYYLQLKERLGANRAALTIARKLLRRAHHIWTRRRCPAEDAEPRLSALIDGRPDRRRRAACAAGRVRALLALVVVGSSPRCS